MASKLHYFEFCHPFSKPITYGRPPEVVELTFFDTRSLKDYTEISAEIVDHL